MYAAIYIVSSLKISVYCMPLGTVRIFISIFLSCKPSTVGASRSYFNCSCLLMTTDMYCIFSVNCNFCIIPYNVMARLLCVCVCVSSVAICDSGCPLQNKIQFYFRTLLSVCNPLSVRQM